MQWPRHPALWDPVCFTDQWTQPMLISSVPLTETGSTHSSHTHIYTNSSYTPTPHTHTHIHTQTPHSLLTHTHSHTLLTHPYTCLTITHTYTLHTHTTSHTPHSPTHTHTHTHTLLTLTHTHTNTNTEPTGAYTQETWGPRGSAQTPGTWSMWEQPRVPAEVSSWSFHTLGATGP